MRGVRAFAGLVCSALAGLSPLEAAARDFVAGTQAQVLSVASSAVRAAAVGISLLGALLIFWRWRRRESALGRGTPLMPASHIDAGWLERHVFSFAPELVGAAYDRRVAGSEVAAVLARMCGESKLASRVAAGARGWNNLELWLLVERDELSGYERELVDRLFADGKTTSADRIQQQYRSVGFEPAAILRRTLSATCDRTLGIRPAFRWPLWVAFGAAPLGVLLTMRAAPSSIVPTLIVAAAGALGPVWGSFVFAPRYHRDPAQPASRARACVACAGASVVALALLIAGLPSLPPLAPFGIAAWGLLGAALVARAAASRESADGLTLRRNLFAARRFLATELERPQPRLEDEWLPHLIALELASEVEHWHQAFGRIDTASRRQRLTQPAESDEPASSWTGGAGALGGIGASGPWIAATAGLTVSASRERGGQGSPLERGLELEHA